MTDKQRELARHALGLPNKKNTTHRNYFVIGVGSDGHNEWMKLVTQGLAIKRTAEPFAGDDLFYLTMDGARLVLEPKEHISREEARIMRSFPVAASRES